MINFTRAFELAWERMHVILFRPFNFGKWCAIGFSAFLAGLLQGGNGVNSSFNGNFNNNNLFSNNGSGNASPNLNLPQIQSSISHAFSGWQMGAIIFLVVIIFVIAFAFILLIYWLGARGQFMFLDNVVRNRGAIGWPWETYARQANSLFLFYVAILFVGLLIVIILLGVAALVGVPIYLQHRWASGGEIAIFVVLGLLYLAFCVVFAILIFIFRELGVPLMFRNGLTAYPAFLETMQLLRKFPGSIALIVLLRIAIFIGVAVMSVIICCMTCCIGALPYIGTMLLLPVLIYVKCFTLDCLAQFGPQYDVWTVDVPPDTLMTPATVPPFNPLPPPG
jgi:hypothetical protein